MKKSLTSLVSFILLLPALPIWAQVVEIPTPKAGYMTPDRNMPDGKIYIKLSTIPQPHRGSTTVDLFISCGPLVGNQTPAQAGCSGVNYPGLFEQGGPGGAFRLLCEPSHYGFDDPIVFPGQSGRGHLHGFFGNDTTDGNSDPAKMADVGGSTCGGGTANRTGYWVPPWIYHCPVFELGCDRSRDGTVYPANVNNAYYKDQYTDDAEHRALVKWWPKGFQMISGDAGNIDPARTVGRMDCFGPNTTGVYPRGSFWRAPSSKEIWDAHARGPQDNPPEAIPESGYVPNPNGVGPPLNSFPGGGSPAPCSEINVLIDFPHCSATDETVLYLPTPVGGTHSGHVNNTENCADPAFRNLHPTVSYNVHSPIPNGADWDYMVQSNDQPMHPGVVRAGSTTTSVVLSDSENSVNDSFSGGYIVVNNERRQIQRYNGTTKVAVLVSPLSKAPVAGDMYAARVAGALGRHADWANGWDTNPNFNGWGRTITDQIIRACYVNLARYPGKNMGFDCHDNNIGDPRPDNVPEPSAGGVYYQLR